MKRINNPIFARVAFHNSNIWISDRETLNLAKDVMVLIEKEIQDQEYEAAKLAAEAEKLKQGRV